MNARDGKGVLDNVFVVLQESQPLLAGVGLQKCGVKLTNSCRPVIHAFVAEHICGLVFEFIARINYPGPTAYMFVGQSHAQLRPRLVHKALQQFDEGIPLNWQLLRTCIKALSPQSFDFTEPISFCHQDELWQLFGQIHKP